MVNTFFCFLSTSASIALLAFKVVVAVVVVIVVIVACYFLSFCTDNRSKQSQLLLKLGDDLFIGKISWPSCFKVTVELCLIDSLALFSQGKFDNSS